MNTLLIHPRVKRTLTSDNLMRVTCLSLTTISAPQAQGDGIPGFCAPSSRLHGRSPLRHTRTLRRLRLHRHPMLKSIFFASIVCTHCDVGRGGQTPWTSPPQVGVKPSKHAPQGGSCADYLLHQGHWAHSGSSGRHLDTGWSWTAPRRDR